MSITQEFSKNLLNIKGNSSGFGFAIQELPSEEAIYFLRLLSLFFFTLHFVPKRLSKKLEIFKFYLNLEVNSLNTNLKKQECKLNLFSNFCYVLSCCLNLFVISNIFFVYIYINIYNI